MSEHEHIDGPATCRNCGEPLHGAFCSVCGQAEKEGHPPSIGHFAHDLVHEVVHVDGSIFRTLRALFFEPGRLTEEYWGGRVVSWIRPLRIFLIVAAIHLLVAKGVGPLNFKTDLRRGPDGRLNAHVGMQNRVETDPSKLATEAESREFAEKFEKFYRTIRYSSVLGFAFASWVLYRRRQPYFVSHLIAGLHFFSFWYVLAALTSLGERVWPMLNVFSLLPPVYLFLMLRRLYPQGWFGTAWRSMALFGWLLATELGLGLAAALRASQGMN